MYNQHVSCYGQSLKKPAHMNVEYKRVWVIDILTKKCGKKWCQCSIAGMNKSLFPSSHFWTVSMFFIKQCAAWGERIHVHFFFSKREEKTGESDRHMTNWICKMLMLIIYYHFFLWQHELKTNILNQKVKYSNFSLPNVELYINI